MNSSNEPIYVLPENGVCRIIAPSWTPSSSGRYNLSLSLEDGTNLAKRKGNQATCTEFFGLEPDMALDNNTDTRWLFQFSDPQLIYVNLGVVHALNPVVLRWETAHTRHYSSYYWGGYAWQNVYGTDHGNGENGVLIFVQSSIPNTRTLYPQANTLVDVKDVILFQGMAVDNDKGGASIVAYRWHSNLES